MDHVSIHVPHLLSDLVYPGSLVDLCLPSHQALLGGQLDRSAHHDPADRDMVHHHCFKELVENVFSLKV